MARVVKRRVSGRAVKRGLRKGESWKKASGEFDSGNIFLAGRGDFLRKYEDA